MSRDVEYNIFLEEDGSCRLDIMFQGMNAPVITGWKSRQNLLSVFLNKQYIPQVFDYDDARRSGLMGNCSFSKEKCLEILDSWNHECIFSIVSDIYEEENDYVKKLHPYERYFAWLSFTGEPLFIEYGKNGTINMALINEERTEMPCADRFHIVDAAKSHGVDFHNLFHSIMSEQSVSQEKALYIAGCMITANYKVKAEISAIFSFYSTESLVNWLLLNTIRNNKYVHCCKYCGLYFGADRNDARTCSTYCTNQYEKCFGRYDNPEIGRLNKCINNAIGDRIKNQTKNGAKYVAKDDPDCTEIDLEEFKKSFRQKYRSYTRRLKDLRSRNELDKFSVEAMELLRWLERTQIEVQSFVRDRMI